MHGAQLGYPVFSSAFGWPHLLIIVGVLVLLFGATRLPALAKSLGSSLRILRNEVRDQEGDSDEQAK
ncbi:MAG: twin-arginine translocase TatA/TatE family subunit [Pseudolysinimonas sp.]|uniref:twin-arginine translocase TatA/TatE family subunit n=1 Tax=Pseudolysinimonas sp. TaxID=2680009 RepID=UPI0032671F38